MNFPTSVVVSTSGASVNHALPSEEGIVPRSQVVCASIDCYHITAFSQIN